jgi:hypothetical protein
MLQDIDLPPNVVIGDKFLEFDNVKGYILWMVNFNQQE